MMKEITVGELKKMTDKEGLILQGCGGDLKEWEDGVNELLTESGILLEGDTFKNVYVFENEGLTNLLFDMDDVKLDVESLPCGESIPTSSLAVHGSVITSQINLKWEKN